MSPSDRQRIVRVPGSRRAKLTAAPGSIGEPTADDEGSGAAAPESGPNDERLRQDVPPHY
jgi:hypothetical protein